MLFRKWGCLVGPENSIFRKLKSVDPKQKPLTTEIVLHFYFPFKVFPENERERESARARDRDLQSAISPSLIAIPSPRPRSRAVVDRDLQSAISRRRWSRSRLGEIAIDDAISRRSRSRHQSRSREDHDLAFARSHRTEIAIDGVNSRRSRSRRRSRDRDRAVDRDQHRGRRTVFSVVVDDFFLGCGLCFLDLCFPSSFLNTRKYFPENFLKCNQTPWKHFPFPEISISGKYVFSGKRFTPTKHSLILLYFSPFPSDDASIISGLNCLRCYQRVASESWKKNNKVRGDRWRPAKNPPMAKLVSLCFFVKENERKFLNGYFLRRSVLL